MRIVGLTLTPAQEQHWVARLAEAEDILVPEEAHPDERVYVGSSMPSVEDPALSVQVDHFVSVDGGEVWEYAGGYAFPGGVHVHRSGAVVTQRGGNREPCRKGYPGRRLRVVVTVTRGEQHSSHPGAPLVQVPVSRDAVPSPVVSIQTKPDPYVRHFDADYAALYEQHRDRVPYGVGILRGADGRADV